MRVLICDDDPMIRGALHDVLGAEDGIEVVAAARDADEAIALAEHHSPDVMVLDVRMPGGGGPRAAREIRSRAPGTGIVAFSAHDDARTAEEMTRAGGSEYLTKGAPNAEIVAAVRRAAAD